MLDKGNLKIYFDRLYLTTEQKSIQWCTGTEGLEAPPYSHSQPGKILSGQVSVSADNAVGDEFLLQRCEGVSLQHIQSVQQLWTHRE